MRKGAKIALIIGIAVTLFLGYCWLNIWNLYQSSKWKVYEDENYPAYTYGGGFTDTYSGGSYDDQTYDSAVYDTSAPKHSYSSASWATEYAAVAMKPELSSCFEIYGEKTINFSTKRVVVESYSYKSLMDLCNALPSDWSSEIQASVERGDYFTSYDLNDTYVEAYTMENLPLCRISEIDPAYRVLAQKAGTKYYQILKYDDGSYRFLFWFEY